MILEPSRGDSPREVEEAVERLLAERGEAEGE